MYSDYINNNNSKACDDKKSREKQDKIINKKFAKNNSIPLNDFKLNKYYFYRVPNTYNIPDNDKFGKLLLSNNNKSGECKRFNKNCHLIR